MIRAHESSANKRIQVSLETSEELSDPREGTPSVYAGGRTVKMANRRLIRYVCNGWLRFALSICLEEM